ncbi:Crp/Fnr family transcriptional regulator [Sphingomonas sp. CL5.1]|uniref:Crp/Fnr family transcriptional regulator n=1 Tax=Sphingomonas sp. CL5.1 TaxID=2653203 RepID=UPI001581944B|nr:Crp/Fnr family transcriptional regulator [Sphingomonas sp. CL5.1]QKS00554.1 Crp/Fnr family transcriptional regulator [Sphingomonas sp. CL5.1]
MHETSDPAVEATSAEARTGDALDVHRAHTYLARPGERLTHIFLLIDGWAARYRLLSDGRRQITAVFVPGDFCDLAWRRARTTTQHVIALTPIRALRIDIGEFEHHVECDPGIRAIVENEAHLASETQCEWLVSLGRRTAMERLAHLFCELVERIGRVSGNGSGTCEMPLTQVDLADVTGLTPVHVNRTLQQMRRAGLIELKSKQLRLRDFSRLRKIAFFRSNAEGRRFRNNVFGALRLFQRAPAVPCQPSPAIEEEDRLIIA